METSANRNVALNVLSANLSVRSRLIQATKRGENSLVPNWTTIKMTEVTKPVNASMPLPSADRAALALEELIEWTQVNRVRLIPVHQAETESQRHKHVHRGNEPEALPNPASADLREVNRAADIGASSPAAAIRFSHSGLPLRPERVPLSGPPLSSLFRARGDRQAGQ